MKSKIYMYLFFFTLLMVLFMYVNQLTIFERQEQRLTAYAEKQEILRDSLAILNDVILEADYFSLLNNDAATAYFERLDMDPAQVAAQVKEVIYEKNLVRGGNALVPLAQMNGEWRINRVEFLNHRWIIADFSNGSLWGEVLLSYFYDQDLVLDITPIQTILH
jgi:hypothetical protein